jgi:fucose permease
MCILIECLAQIGQAAEEPGTSENSKMRQILNLKTVHLLAVFILVYVGVEVTIAGQWYGLCFVFTIIRKCQAGSSLLKSMFAGVAHPLGKFQPPYSPISLICSLDTYLRASLAVSMFKISLRLC